MPRISEVNPDAATQLTQLAESMRQNRVNRALAARTLKETSRRQRVGTFRARQSHSRRPRARLV